MQDMSLLVLVPQIYGDLVINILMHSEYSHKLKGHKPKTH